MLRCSLRSAHRSRFSRALTPPGPRGAPPPPPPAYAALLAACRPSQQVFAGSDAAGTARGAALLAKWPPRNFQPPQLIAVSPCAIDGLHTYRNVWTKAVLER